MIRYIAELANRLDYEPIYFLRYSDPDYLGLYMMELSRPETDTYWTDWGGFYDNPTGNIEVLFGSFLQRVYSFAELKATSGSLLVTGGKAYINLSRPPWAWASDEVELDQLELFSSFVRDELSLSDWTYLDDASDAQTVKPFLQIPKVPQKLSDPISGSTLYTTFGFKLINNDGGFDDTESLNYFNTPCRILRTEEDNPTLADFDVIRSGLVDYVDVSASTLAVTAADIFRTLTEPVCDRITADSYPDSPDKSIDKEIPIGYGALKNVPLLEVGTNEYLAIDPEYLDSVTAVYDKDGTSISYTVSAGVIAATDAKTADVTGKSANRIGEIITAEIEDKAGVLYIASNWDLSETDAYTALSAEINLYFDGGSVRDLVGQALKNDLAFLISKNDGRLTLRQWGGSYGEHVIDSWRIMAIPSKKYQEAKKFFISSAAVLYSQDIKGGQYDRQSVYDDDADAIKALYRTRKTGTFETDLTSRADALDLGERLVDRFGTLSEIVKVDLGYDCGGINLLDRVTLPIQINGRGFSTKTEWIVREVDPAQDSLTLEALS